MTSLEAKRERLLTILRDCDAVVVAFSGGVDSAVVAKAAALALGERAIAITADSPSVPRTELADAQRLATLIGIRHRIVRTTEFTQAAYVANDGTRCYHCKTELYTQIETLLPELGITTVCSGANLDDNGDYRPGLTAAAEHHVRHPLQEAGFTKADVRALARLWELPVWDKPAITLPVEPPRSWRSRDSGTHAPHRTRRGVFTIARGAGLPCAVPRT